MRVGRWSLKKIFMALKLVLIVAVLGCILLVLLNYSSTRQFTMNTVERYDDLYKVFEYNDAFRTLAHEYLFVGDDGCAETLRLYNQACEGFEQDFSRLMEHTELKSTKVYLNGLNNMFCYYQASIGQMMQARETGSRSEAYELFSEVSHRSDLIKEVMLRYYLRYSDDVSHYVQNGLMEYGRLQKIQTIVCVLTLGLALVILSYLLQSNQKSIALLMTCTGKISSGDYAYVQKQRFPSENDWGRLGIAIQQMSARIEYYLGEMKEKNRLSMEMAALENERLRMVHCAREAEFKAMHNQMSPHFIYNTLNIALQLAYEEKAEKTAKMMRAVIGFMRYYTKNVTSIIDLDSEIRFVKDYLYINQMRYGSRISFSIHKAEDVPNIKLPAVSIQPLVENAIIHGLKDCTEQGSVAVDIVKAEDAVLITVEDNGHGIPYERLEEIMSAQDDGRHIGLHNVQERLRFFFGDKDNLNIESQPGCGTVITLRLPLDPQEKAVSIHES